VPADPPPAPSAEIPLARTKSSDREETGSQPPHIDEARRALAALYPPSGEPPQGMKLKTALSAVNDWLRGNPRQQNVSPPEIKGDTLRRALALKR
jgi:hypothetical protein